MTTTPAIEIPRLPNERNERYEARVLYLTMGADRSLDAVRRKVGKSKELIERWSTQNGWVALARAYDDALAQRAVAAHQAEYLAALEKHRKSVLKDADDLTTMLNAYQAQTVRAITGRRVVEAGTGDVYYIPEIEITGAAIPAIVRGRIAVADLRAHALDIPRLQAALAPTEDADGEHH